MIITPTMIFEAGQILTLAKAKELKGHAVICTSPEYEANAPKTTAFVIDDIITEWDHAATRAYPGDQYKNFQEYYQTLGGEYIDRFKSTYVIVNSWRVSYFTCLTGTAFFNEPTFTGSDADRPVYYLLLGPITK